MFERIEIPLVSEINPRSVRPGQTEVELTLEGQDLAGIVELVVLGGGVRVLWLRQESASRLKAAISVEPSAALGWRHLLLTDPRSGVIVARRQLQVTTGNGNLTVRQEESACGGEFKSSAIFVNPCDWT